MSEIKIPPVALEAGARAIRTFYSDEPLAVCDGAAYKAASACCIAMLEAWPGMEQHINWPYGKLTHIIIPLPTQENSDDQ